MARTERPLIGALLIVFASACFAGTGLCVQLSAPHASDPVIIFMGFAVGGAFVIPLALSRGLRFLVTPRPGLLVTRAVVGLLQIASLFMALQTLPLLETMLLREVAPLWVPILLLLLFGQRMPGRLWVPIAIGFVGTALVLHPKIADFTVGYLFALANGLLFGLQSILSRRVNLAGEPVLRVLCYVYGICIVATVVPAVLTLHAMPAATWLYLVSAGLLMLISTVSLLQAFKHAPAYLLAPLGYTAVAFSALLDWVVFGLTPTVLTIAGTCLVVAAGLLLLRLDRSANHQRET